MADLGIVLCAPPASTTGAPCTSATSATSGTTDHADFAIGFPLPERPTVMPMHPGHGASRIILWKIVLLAGWLAAATASAADTLDLAQYRGKVVLVDFWASWCTPCRKSFPWLNEMQRKYGEHGLVVIGVNVDSTRSDAEAFLRDVPSQIQVIYDPTGALATQYQVPGMPSSFLFGPDGKLVSNHIGFQQSARDQREAELRQLLPTALPN